MTRYLYLLTLSFAALSARADVSYRCVGTDGDESFEITGQYDMDFVQIDKVTISGTGASIDPNTETLDPHGHDSDPPPTSTNRWFVQPDVTIEYQNGVFDLRAQEDNGAILHIQQRGKVEGHTLISIHLPANADHPDNYFHKTNTGTCYFK